MRKIFFIHPDSGIIDDKAQYGTIFALPVQMCGR